MKLELEKIFIKDIRLDDKTHVRDGALYVNKEEAEKPVLEDDKLTGHHADIAESGESIRITPVEDVIESRVKISGGKIFPGVIGKANPQVRTGRTRTLEGRCVVTVGKIVKFQEGVVDMSGPAADYYPLSRAYNPCTVVESVDGLETHIHERAARMAGLKIVAYVGGVARGLKPDEIITYETRPIFGQAAMYPDLPKVGYAHILQSQGLLHDTYYYGVDVKQFIPTSMYLTETMDGAIVLGGCVVPCDKAITYHHFHNPVIENRHKHHGRDINFMGIILANENVFLTDKERHSDMVAKLCNRMGLDGTLIIEKGYSNPDTDLMMSYCKVECAETKAILITDRFPGKDGESQSLADVCEEADALTSCGQGDATLQLPAMNKVVGTQDFAEMQTGGWNGCKDPDGSFEAEPQIIIASTIANDFNKLAARGYQSKIKEMER